MMVQLILNTDTHTEREREREYERERVCVCVREREREREREGGREREAQYMIYNLITLGIHLRRKHKIHTLTIGCFGLRNHPS